MELMLPGWNKGYLRHCLSMDNMIKEQGSEASTKQTISHQSKTPQHAAIKLTKPTRICSLTHAGAR